MAHLVLRRIDGSTETRELSRSQPLTIGRQKINDICIPESDVHSFHCRIGWNKSKYEVTSANSDGIEVNSTHVAQVELKHGDVIRIGTVDLIFESESKSVAAGVESSSSRASSRKSRVKSEVKEKPVEEYSLFEGDVVTESQAMLDSLTNQDFEEVLESKRGDKKKKSEAKPRPVQKRRPGEQEIVRSPLVVGLTGGGIVLLLLTGIIWFLLGREQAHRLYERAVSEMKSGQFAQAIASYEQFVQQYPGHGSRRQAVRGIAKAQVLKEISGGSPAWKRGLERLDELIKAHRSEPDFSEMHGDLREYAEQISLGAAKSAEVARDSEFLAVSKEAQNLLERYADPSTPIDPTIRQIVEQQKKAERAIEKQLRFDVAMKNVDEALAGQKPMLALSERERLVKAFPEFANSKRVQEALVKSLDLERSVVAVNDTERNAETTDDVQHDKPTILGILHSRFGSEDSSSGKIVFALAKDSCYAMNTVSGDLIWRRVIGVNSPFFPQKTSDSLSSVLMFDTRKQALVSCDLATGRLLWRQPLSGRALGAPLIHEQQIYLPIEGNSLVRIDADSGRLSATVHFSQNLAATPALTRDGNFLLIPGEMAMIYALALRATSTQQSLAAASTTFTDHAAGSVSTPPLTLGKLLLICENDRAESARLRLWDASNPTAALVKLKETVISGQIRDIPILRGKQLVVPLAGEQFAAFVVTDEAGSEGIAPVGQYGANQSQVGKRSNAPIFVTLGADNQFWSAGSAFRRFEIGTDSIRMDSSSSAPGIASQPVQQDSDYFFVGRRSRMSDAVTISAIERDKITSHPWRCIVGDAPREIIASREGGAIWVGESGTLYSIGRSRMETGGIDLKAGTDLELPVNLVEPVRVTRLHDQRIAVFASGDTKQLLLLNPSGQVVGKHPLTDSLEADPILLDEGIVLPQPSRLKLLPLAASKKSVQDWQAPVGDGKEKRWVHLVRIDGSEFIACDETGRLIRFQCRQGNVPHLAEVTQLPLEHPVDIRPVHRDEFILVADAGGTCRQLNARSFDLDGQRTVVAPIKNLWSVEKNTIVQSGDGQLHCLDDGKDLPEKWTFDLASLEPTGQIHLRNDSIWVGCRDGTILAINFTTGVETERLQVPQSLSLGLRKLNENLLAVASDGTIYRLD